MHGLRAIADQRGDIVLLHRIARLNDKPDAGAKPCAYEMQTDGAECQQRGDRCTFSAGLAITDDE